jgi:MFS family permease
VDDHGRLHPHHRAQPLDVPLTETQRVIALGILCLCALTTGIDMTITNVALPFIGRALDAPTNELQWTVDAYNITLAGLLVIGGALADRVGRRRVFLASFALFGIASALAAFSSSAEALIGYRALMGVGGAGFTAPALAIIASMYPPEDRAGAIGAFVVFGATGLTVGPIAGGLLLDHFWWGSVFLVNVPVVIVGVLLGMRTIPESRAPEPAGGRPPLDLLGAALSVVGLTSLLYGIIEGPNRGWSDPAVIAGLVVGTVAVISFVRRELHSRSPLFDVRILRRPAVATGAITLPAGLSLLISPPSTVVMNDLPEAKAGDGSSLNFVSRFVGASIGIAIVGSVLATVYARDVDTALAPVDPAQSAAAQGSIQGALVVAHGLGPADGSALAEAARSAFDSGATAAYAVVAVLGVLAACWAWFALGRRTTSS